VVLILQLGGYAINSLPVERSPSFSRKIIIWKSFLKSAFFRTGTYDWIVVDCVWKLLVQVIRTNEMNLRIMYTNHFWKRLPIKISIFIYFVNP
jgi:hypothetical protein